MRSSVRPGRHIHNSTLAVILAGAISTATGTAFAQDNGNQVLGVVELFTSQGCYSCPPADRLLEELAKRDDVIALGYHVDYWDYLGWKDTLGSPENTARQYAYRKTMGTRSVYTPQAVVNGAGHVNGGNAGAIAAIISDTGPLKAVDVAVEDTVISIDVPDAEAGPEMTLVCYSGRDVIDIARGENAGKEIVYVNSVTAYASLGQWTGNPIRFDVSENGAVMDGADGCAVLAQEQTGSGSPARIVAAAVLPRW